MGGGWVGGIAIIVTSSRLQVTLRVEPCVELELSLPESDLEPSLLIVFSVWPYSTFLDVIASHEPCISIMMMDLSDHCAINLIKNH